MLVSLSILPITGRVFEVMLMAQKMDVLTPHTSYMALGSSDEARQAGYRELFRYNLDNVDIHEIRNAVTFSMPLGDSCSCFCEQIDQAIGRTIGQAIRGRPMRRKAE